MPLERSRYSPFIIVEKISQAERDSSTIGQLGISRGGPHFRQVGWKFERWLDLVFLERIF
jgi:hypothetical protein